MHFVKLFQKIENEYLSNRESISSYSDSNESSEFENKEE